MSSEPTAIAPINGQPGPAPLAVGGTPADLLLSRLRVMWCNVPLQSPEAKALLASVVADVTIKDDDRIGQVFGVVAALVQHPSEVVTETGEVFTAPAVTLLTETGETFRWFSAGVADCLAVLTMDRPAGKWSPPIYLKCVGLKTKNGRRRMTLQAAPPPVHDREAKGGKRG